MKQQIVDLGGELGRGFVVHCRGGRFDKWLVRCVNVECCTRWLRYQYGLGWAAEASHKVVPVCLRGKVLSHDIVCVVQGSVRRSSGKRDGTEMAQ